TGNEVIDRFIEDMQSSYGICVEVLAPSPTSWGKEVISCDALEETDYAELGKYVRIFRNEFFKYPRAFVENTRLQKVAMVKNLINQGVSVAAMPDYYQENLYMDIFVGNYDSVYQKHVVHHEFYHMIEQELNGSAYYKDPAWAKFNDVSFVYGTGGIKNRSSDLQPVIHPQNGFISGYAMTGLEEDKAELFAGLLTSEEKDKIRMWAKKDLILKNKIRLLSGFLKKYSLDLD
ncbi:MAG: putative zinc-binding metallopeptidase, partial [Cytophagaceae bacterium]